MSVQKYVFKKKQKTYTVVIPFNMITNQGEAKSMTEHISFDYKCKFNSTTCNSKCVNVNVKIIINRKMIIVGILAHVFVRIVSN